MERMSSSTLDQVVDFYELLFKRIFLASFGPRILDRLKRDEVKRRVEEVAGAASRSLTRFLGSQQLTDVQVAGILESFDPVGDTISHEDIANPNLTPEAIVEDLLRRLPSCPESLRQTGQDAVYRVALHTVVQVLMLLGPLMAEWQRLGFSSTYELLPRVVKRLHQIGEQLDDLGHSGQDAADEGYEIGYRDYLIQHTALLPRRSRHRENDHQPQGRPFGAVRHAPSAGAAPPRESHEQRAA